MMREIHATIANSIQALSLSLVFPFLSFDKIDLEVLNQTKRGLGSH